jgi:glutathione synthase/RimK-type ligase-like ATP-grasp enzyme
MVTKRVAYLTYQEMPDGTADDQLTVPVLKDDGIEVEFTVWDDPSVDWKSYDGVVIRSPWDYFRKIPQFRTWLDEFETLGVPLFNPLSLIRWNMDKFYLQELSQEGVPVLPALWLRPGEKHNLAEIMQQQGWDEVVVKPTVSAGGYRTERVSKDTVEAYQALLDEILLDNGAMIQQYAPVVAEVGEWSLLFFDGEYSHSALKHPQDGDFRVQPRYGGTHEILQASDELVAQARALIQKINRPMLYARVDGVLVDGAFYLMELEAFEPSLFFSVTPDAPVNFAKALVRWLEKLPEKSTSTSSTNHQT